MPVVCRSRRLRVSLALITFVVAYNVAHVLLYVPHETDFRLGKVKEVRIIRENPFTYIDPISAVAQNTPTPCTRTTTKRFTKGSKYIKRSKTLKIDTWIRKSFLPKTYPHLISSSNQVYPEPSEEQKDLANALPNTQVHDGLQCDQIVTGDRNAIKQGLLQQSMFERRTLSPVMLADLTYVAKTRDCHVYKRDLGYVLSPVTREEKEFPIAYSILWYKDVDMFERLLRAIYRPQNYYCIHLDHHADPVVHEQAGYIIRCFDNVFFASKAFDIYWGQPSILNAERQCMVDLWRFRGWKYFINLTGQEFPLKTNWELVQILKAFNGSNHGSVTTKRAIVSRFRRQLPAPKVHGQELTLVKGQTHVMLQRGMVDFILHDLDVQAFFSWVRQTKIPDETFFAVLNHSPQSGAPGAYKGIPETSSDYPNLTRHKVWGDSKQCAGGFVRNICIFGIGDVPALAHSPAMFANKFHADLQPFGYDCLEQWFYNRTREHILGRYDLNQSWYAHFEFTWNHT